MFFFIADFILVLVKMEVRVEDGSINSEAVTSQIQSENFVDNGWASFPEVAEREEVKRVGYILQLINEHLLHMFL